MFIDLLNSGNYIMVNMDAIRIFGLNTATYCAELLNVYKKAYIKNKLIDGDFFKIDRKFMFERTSLSVEDQLVSDLNLMKISVINKHEEDPDIISFDFILFASIISSEDVKLVEDISKKVKIKSPRGIKESKRQIIKKNLKNAIPYSNYELVTAMREWIDSIFTNPRNYMSKKTILDFKKCLDNYTKGDLDLALTIIGIATTQSYKNCEWAINTYEKSEKIKQQNKNFMFKNTPRTTEQKKATKETVDDIVF